MSCKVSIIIPVYNAEKYIGRTIDSILNQSETDFEIIAVNDGSTDKSYNIMKKLAQKDKRIKIYTKTNEGVSATRNYGIKKATGKYLLFVDADDMLTENGLHNLCEIAKKYNADITIGNSKVIDLNGKTIKSHENGKIYQQNRKELLTTFFKDNGDFDSQSVWAKLFARDICNELRFADNQNSNEDRYYFFQEICNSKKIVLLNRDVYIYEKHFNSLSTSKVDKRIFSNIKFAEQMSSYVKKYEPWATDLSLYNLLVTSLMVYRNFYRDKQAINKYHKELVILRKKILKIYKDNYIKIGFMRKLELFIVKYMKYIYYYFIRLVDIVRS